MWARTLLLLTSVANARPWHGSVSASGALLATGANGDHLRGELELDLEPDSRYGALVAWRAVDEDHHGLLCAGLIFEAGAARPRLVIDFHADVGADLDQRAPLVGGGLRTVVGLAGPLGVALDAGGYIVFDDTWFVLSFSAGLAARW